MAYWKRVERSVYKIKVEHELIGEYERVESSATLPLPVMGRNWTIMSTAVQYDVWSDSVPESDRLPPITVDGDRLYKDIEDSSEYYRRIK